MQVALACNSTIALSVVHWTVWGIQVYEGVQTLLNVHACTKCEGTTHNYTDFATVHLVEDFLLLLDSHVRTDDYHLLGWHTLLDEFLSDVLVEVEASMLILIDISKQSNGAVILGSLFERA